MLGDAVSYALVRAGHPLIRSTHAQGTIDDMHFVYEAVRVAAPDVIINCAGVIPLANRTAIEMVRANALGPHVLSEVARALDVRLIHISTDCVFSGMTWAGTAPARLTSTSPADALDPYGRSKALGEPHHAVVLRTSFVGRRHGLEPWLIEHEGGTVDGWQNVMWSGSTVEDVAKALAAIVGAPPEDGIYHLATQRPISKYEALRALRSKYQIDVTITPAPSPIRNLALAPSAGMALRPFVDALADPEGEPWYTRSAE